MSLHNIRGTPVFIHELQSVMLISTPAETPVSIDALQAIVNEVVSDRDKHEALGTRAESTYQIQEPTLGFDVFVRQGNALMQYSFTETGEFISDSPSRSLDDAGLFHFQFTVPERPIEAFRINDADFRIIRVTTEAFISLPVDEQDKMLDEIAAFNKTHFPDHFELWELNDKSPDQVRDHFRHLQSSLSSLYVIRDHEDKMIAINGISATPDCQLTYQSMTITRTADRGKGFMAVDLARATSDYSKAVMTAYLVNSGIRHSLGESAITQPNSGNQFPTERNPYLEGKLADVKPIDSLDSFRKSRLAFLFQREGSGNRLQSNLESWGKVRL